MRVRREIAAAVAAVALAACSAAAAGSSGSPGDARPPSTVGGVGVLPSQVSVAADDVGSTRGDGPGRTDDGDATADSDSETSSTDDDTGVGPRESETESESESDSESDATSSTRPRPSSATTSTTFAQEPLRTIGEQVTGNRVLMIGDSILASTSRRYGNNMCRALEPLGWQVAIEAEVSREISFGNRVLRTRLDAGWDAAVILLGNNYGQNPNAFMAELDKMLAALQPRPVLLLTVTEFEPIQREVNDIIRAVGGLYPNVTIVEWAITSNFRGVLSGDGLHLTDDGREFLAQQLVPYFGTAPLSPGDCLSSKFRDDSAGSVNGPSTTSKPGNRPPSTSKPTSSTPRPRPTSTTTRPTGTTAAPTPTTARPASPGSTNAPVQTSPAPTSPPATSPPQTSPPQTSPPQTSPPQTSPPQTSPPQTSPPQTSPPQTSPPQTSPPVAVTLPPQPGG